MYRRSYEKGTYICSLYQGLPGISQDIFLLDSDQSLPLIEDKKMLSFFERSKKGGISYVGTRKVDLREKPESSIVHIDLNNRM